MFAAVDPTHDLSERALRVFPGLIPVVSFALTFAVRTPFEVNAHAPGGPALTLEYGSPHVPCPPYVLATFCTAGEVVPTLPKGGSETEKVQVTV